MAEISELAASMAPGEKVTAKALLSVMGESSESVFTSALIDVKEQVAIPKKLVAEQAPITFKLPVELTVGVSKGIGL